MIRRFDVFAVFNFVQNRRKGMPEDKAKGDAIWLAKHVAGGKRIKVGGGVLDNKINAAKHCACKEEIKKEEPQAYWKSLSGIEQTDVVYDHDIVRRMGEGFYNEVFLPRIQALVGKKYVEFRDVIKEEMDKAWEGYANGKVRGAETLGTASGPSFRLQI